MNRAYYETSALILALPLLALAAAPAWADVTSRGKVQQDFLSAKPTLSVIARAPEFALRDVEGKEVRLSDYRGRVVLLAFIFTSCSQACPLIGAQMAALQAQLRQARQFPAKAGMLSVTVDPLHDTPEVLERYAARFGADAAGWRFLRDSPDRLGAVLTTYDEWTKKLPKGEIDHPARVFLIDPQGNIREMYSLAFFNERQVFLDIQALLRERR